MAPVNTFISGIVVTCGVYLVLCIAYFLGIVSGMVAVLSIGPVVATLATTLFFVSFFVVILASTRSLYAALEDPNRALTRLQLLAGVAAGWAFAYFAVLFFGMGFLGEFGLAYLESPPGGVYWLGNLTFYLAVLVTVGYVISRVGDGGASAIRT